MNTIGWWVKRHTDDVLRARGGDESQPFLPEVLRSQLLTLNPGLLSAANVDEVVRRLRVLPASMAGNERYLLALRGTWTVYDPKEQRERNLTLIDFEHLDRNKFHFTQELRFVDRDARRMDMALWINGLPVVVVENKSPTVVDAQLEAFDQVQRVYVERIPEFLKYPPLMVAAASRLHYAPTWNSDPKAMHRWKVEGHDYGLERLAKSFFERRNLLEMLQDFIIFYRNDDQVFKFTMRPHQMRAVRKVVQRVMAPFQTSEVAATSDVFPRSGLHWHTQGSGKTLTMILAANRLRRELSARGENPTLLIVVDRRELEGQMMQNLEAFGFPTVVRAKGRHHLVELLESDYRGLIVTLVHKFDHMPKQRNQRSNIVLMIDEAHRSQEGDLAIYMRAALPNAFYFGFTGTPIDNGKIGRGTFETFGKPDPTGYQDKYGMDESIEDGTTVPLYYTLAPSELHVDREVLEKEFFQVVEADGAASQEAISAILEKAEKLKAVLKAPARVAAIAANIADHFTHNIEPLGFKAFVVAVDREACALYKQALDQHLPPPYSRVVYTGHHKDTPLLRQYHLEEDEEKLLRRNFRDPAELPKILIVTEKLLTGYDAPVLYGMYLDKPLKDHTLLQAIARVNRPYPNKSSGLIVDYMGVFEDLQRALAFDAATVSKGLINLEELRQRFASMLDTAEGMLATIDLSTRGDRVARMIDYFFDQERRDAFTRLFKELQTAYEIISPDPFLVDFLDDYALIAQVYEVVNNYYDPASRKRQYERELLKKTDSLIRDNVQVAYVATPLPIYPVSQDIARVIQADNVSDQVKVVNLYRSFMVHVAQNEAEQPYLISIGEQVEQILQRLRDRQISVEAALSQLQTKVAEAAQSQEEQRASNLSGRAFALFWVMRGHGVTEDDARAKATEVEALIKRYSGWAYSPRMESELRIKLYGVLRQPMKNNPTQMVAVAEDLLRMYGTVQEAS
jgi:type I restriction enzyme R subunit